jgi:hypothetical protein
VGQLILLGGELVLLDGELLYHESELFNAAPHDEETEFKPTEENLQPPSWTPGRREAASPSRQAATRPPTELLS